MVEEEDITVAQYNDPFTSPWKSRNKVSLKVVKIWELVTEMEIEKYGYIQNNAQILIKIKNWCS